MNTYHTKTFFSSVYIFHIHRTSYLLYNVIFFIFPKKKSTRRNIVRRFDRTSLRVEHAGNEIRNSQTSVPSCNFYGNALYRVLIRICAWVSSIKATKEGGDSCLFLFAFSITFFFVILFFLHSCLGVEHESDEGGRLLSSANGKQYCCHCPHLLRV